MKVLICSFYFPPAGGGGTQRPLKFAGQLPEYGIETQMLAPTDPGWIHRDEELSVPPTVAVHRALYIGPKGRLPAEELYARHGLARLMRKIALTPRRLVVPDENASWLLTAIPPALRLVRREGIDAILTTSPPTSVHLIGYAVKRLTGIPWVADLRDSIAAHPDRLSERLGVRMRELAHLRVARLVAKRADAIVAVTETIAREMEALGTSANVEVIPNGSDFEDFEGLEHRTSERFRVTHTGSFFGARSPRPFLAALAGLDLDVVARFIGDFRQADLDWAKSLGLGDRLEIHPFTTHRRALELQRDSEALLLLLPDVGERGRDIPSGKLFEYLAAGRPILAAVPVDGTAADLVREAGAGVVVPHDDVAAIREALTELVDQWKSGTLDDVELPAELRARISRKSRVVQLATLLRSLA